MSDVEIFRRKRQDDYEMRKKLINAIEHVFLPDVTQSQIKEYRQNRSYQLKRLLRDSQTREK